MNKVVKTILQSVLVSIGTMLHYGDAFSDQLTEQYEIVAILPTQSGIAVQLSPNPPQCTGSWWGAQALITKAIDTSNTLISNLMAAFMANKKITAIHYSMAGDGSCSNGNEINIFAYKIVK